MYILPVVVSCVGGCLGLYAVHKSREHVPTHHYARTSEAYYSRAKVTSLMAPWSIALKTYTPSVHNDDGGGGHHRNPGGRTGVRGRGALEKYGPNPVEFRLGPERKFLILHGYVDHPVNTDNAWLHGSIYADKQITVAEALEHVSRLRTETH